MPKKFNLQHLKLQQTEAEISSEDEKKLPKRWNKNIHSIFPSKRIVKGERAFHFLVLSEVSLFFSF